MERQLASAEKLALQDKHQFQAWVLSLIKARPINEGKKGADRGLDGVLAFANQAKRPAKKAVVQVKGGVGCRFGKAALWAFYVK